MGNAWGVIGRKSSGVLPIYAKTALISVACVFAISLSGCVSEVKSLKRQLGDAHSVEERNDPVQTSSNTQSPYITPASTSTANTVLSLEGRPAKATETPLENKQGHDSKQDVRAQHNSKTKPQKSDELYRIHPGTSWSRETFYGQRESFERGRLIAAAKLTDKQKKQASFRGSFANHEKFMRHYTKLKENSDQVLYRASFYPEWQDEEEAITRELTEDIVRQNKHTLTSVFIFDAVKVGGKLKWKWRDLDDDNLIIDLVEINGETKGRWRGRNDGRLHDEKVDKYLEIKERMSPVHPSVARYVLNALQEAQLVELKITEGKSVQKESYLQNISRKLQSFQGVQVEKFDSKIVLTVPIYELLELYEGFHGEDLLGLACPKGGKPFSFWAHLKPLIPMLNNVAIGYANQANIPNILRSRVCAFEEDNRFKIRDVNFYPELGHHEDIMDQMFRQYRFILEEDF